ncbi:MAG: nucleotidyltransferase domain-containing protein [Anaerolineae bacterium]|nr:nucleotidyltransferase domain-containing protein [Anaerolineae bacterium]
MSPGEAHVKEALRPVVEALCQGLDGTLVSLALFGSRARGDATPHSDWDLLLIAHDLPARVLQRHFFLKTLLPERWRARLHPSEDPTRVRVALAVVVSGDRAGRCCPV